MKQQKSSFLRGYLPVLAETHAFQRFYVDASTGDPLPEEVQTVLEQAAAFSKVYIIVPDSEHADKVTEISAGCGADSSPMVMITAEDINEGIKQSVRQLHKQAPTLLWLEPGKQVLAWSTMQLLAYWKTEAVLKIDATAIAEWPAQKLDQFFGNREWEPIVHEYQGALRKYLRSELLRLYVNRLRGIGFSAIHYQQVQKSGRRRYFVIWAAQLQLRSSQQNAVKTLDAPESAQLRLGL